MFEYLVTSKTRRALLKLLWGDGVSGTTRELAEKAGVAFAGAYEELKAMTEFGLAKKEWRDGRKVFSANADHPGARLMKGLVKQETRVESSFGDHARRLRENLAFLGLPVNATKTEPGHDVSTETLLAEAANLAQEDASVARTLPLLYLKFSDSLNYDLLKHESWKRGNKHRVGFFLDLAGQLGNKPELSEVAQTFLDHRCKVPNPFFKNQSALSRQLSELRTPDLARKWGWRMNMGMDAFETAYEKFARETVSA